MGTDIHGRLQYRYDHMKEGVWYDGGLIENGRNYRVFAMLAGVRNGTGFAGVKTHKPILPIAEPRGIPAGVEVDEDAIVVRDEWRDNKEIDRTWLGDHSHSWVTLKELIDWPGWGLPLHQCGYITPEEKARLDREGGTPQSWCGGTNDPTAIFYEWTVPFSSTCRVFKAWVDYLALKYSQHENVRLVFGFDS